uniref:Uncharacterized protein n=1 Tax=Lepeophtheirus salmonis TaxID=72036 RepID=A0A0K2UHD3_LEPSM
MKCKIEYILEYQILNFFHFGYVQVEKMILEGDTRNSIWTSSEPPSTPSASLKGYKGRRALSKIPNWI